MLSAILSLAAPAIFSSVPALAALGVPSFVASGIGSGLGALLEGRKGDEALQAAALGGLGGALAGGTAPIGATADLASKVPQAGSAIAQTPAIGAQGSGQFLRGFGNTTTSAANLVTPRTIVEQAAPSGLSLLTSTPALAAGAATGLGLPPMTPDFKKDEGPEPPEGMKPIGTIRTPPPGYDPGKDGEFDYRFPPNFRDEPRVFPDDPRVFQEGGLASLEVDSTEMNDKELINKAIDAIQNELPNPEEVLGVFIARFGEEALADLVRKVQDGTFDETVERSEGMIDGMGDGMDDMVPAKLEGQDDVLLSDGEFIVPADVVSGLGNGSSKAGSDRLYDMMDRVRQMRTGTTEQPDDVPTEQMMPA
jgi:hypothetical protein